MTIYEQYLQAKQQVDEAKANLEKCQVELYKLYQDRLDEIDVGTLSAEDSGYKVTIVKKESTSVDQKLADVVQIGFRKKYELDKTSYKKLTAEDKKRVDECLTTKPAKPSFKVEKIDED